MDSNMRDLINKLQKIEEGAFSDLDLELQELKARKPDATPEETVAHIRRVMGDDAAEYVAKHVANLKEADIEFLQYPEGYEPPPAPKKSILDKYDWTMYLDNEVLSMMDSFIHKMKSQNVWDKGVELAGGEEELLRSIQYEAEDVVESYRGTGEGIGTSDINHFVRSIFRDLGEDDIWGWDKPKMASDEEMERAKAVRGMKAGKAIRSAESIEEDDSDDWLSDEEYRMIKDVMAQRGHEPHSLGMSNNGALMARDDLAPGRPAYTIGFNGEVLDLTYDPDYVPNEKEMSVDQEDWMLDNPFEGLDEAEEDKWAPNYAQYEDTEKWEGQTVRIKHTTNGQHEGETGKVVKADKYRDETGGWQAEFQIKLYSGPVITLYPGEWSYDQLELEYDPTHRPDGKYNPELEEEVVEVPAGLRGEEGSDLSGRDAEQFINSLGPEDSPDTEVIDPDSGDVLDWPDRGTRRAQRDAEYQAQKDREEEEAWDTPMLYTSDLKKHDDRSWDRISDFRFNAEYTDHYDVEWANIEDLVDDPQQYYEGDYDIGVDIPVKISRTDGKKFDKQDRENFKELYKLFRLATYNISVAYAGSSDEGKTAHFYPTFF
jgi:hypothetical protein